MGRLYALDTTVVVILGGGKSAEDRARERAEGLLLDHEEAGDTVGIPAPAFAECCHCEVEAVLVVWPLNSAAAVLTNRLTGPMIEAGKKKGCTKRAAKLDALILATAETVGCAGLYTTDTWFDDVAKRQGLRIKILPLPPLRPLQTTLPSAE